MSAQTVETVEEEVTGGKKKLLLIVLVVLIAIGGAGGWFFLKQPANAEEVPQADGDIVPMPALTTTLGDPVLHHARVSIAVVLVEGADPTVIEPRFPLLQDELLRELTALNADALRTTEGSEKLRVSLTEDAQKIWGEDVVRRVVLTEMLVQ